jgi:hypothetical protein
MLLRTPFSLVFWRRGVKTSKEVWVGGIGVCVEVWVVRFAMSVYHVYRCVNSGF